MLALAGALESQSSHPLAQTIVRKAQNNAEPFPSVGSVISITGQGLRSTMDGKSVLLGNLKLISESGVKIPPEIINRVGVIEEQGKTTTLVMVDQKIIGLIALADIVRPETRVTLKQLLDIGIEKTVILTGDNPRVAAAIANEAGITEYFADLMPEDKAVTIRNLVKKYGVVAMVGDGVNDAPALANATVGIAMGGAGTDVALETADVALMSDNLQKLPFAVGLGRATRRIIIQNLGIALGVITILVIASLAGWTGIGVAILFHEGSTIVVVLNALRLLGYKG